MPKRQLSERLENLRWLVARYREIGTETITIDLDLAVELLNEATRNPQPMQRVDQRTCRCERTPLGFGYMDADEDQTWTPHKDVDCSHGMMSIDRRKQRAP